MKDKYLCQIALLCACFMFLFGLDVYPYNLKQITNKDNLSNSSVTSFAQDERGVMWIGTCDGLNVYDSRDIRWFPAAGAKPVLSGSLIDGILYAGKNTFWVQTYYGLNRINSETQDVDIFSEFGKGFFLEKDKNDNIFVIQEDNTISYYTELLGTFKKTLVSGIIFSDILHFFIDANDTLWIVTKKGYLCSYALSYSNSGEITFLPKEARKQLASQILHSSYDEDGFVYYIDTNYDLYVWTVDDGDPRWIINLEGEIKKRRLVSSIIRHHDDFFIGFQTEGLLLLEKKDSDRYQIREIEINCGVFSLSKDKIQDIVWIGTDGQGVYIYSDTQYSIKSTDLSNLTHRMQRPVRAIYLDDQQTLWVGSKGDGILKIYDYDVNKNIFNMKTENLTSENTALKDNSVYCFTPSKKNKNILWIGNEEGLNYYSYSEQKIKPVDLQIDGLPFKYIHAIYETDDSEIFFASVGMGVGRARVSYSRGGVVLEDIQSYVVNNGEMKSNYFFTIFVEADSTIWFGNRGLGPFKFNRETSTLSPVPFYSKPQNRAINAVLSIQKDDLGNYLFGTSFGLVKSSDKDDYQLFNTSDGFSNNTIHSILKGNNDMFWLTTNRGIVAFNSEKNSFYTFELDDGLKVIEFSDGASFKDDTSGTLFFGGVNGFVSIVENENYEQSYMSPIYFDRLTISGEPQNIQDLITQKKGESVLSLKYEQNFFSLSFTPIDYVNSSNHTFYYKLDGLMDQWFNNGESNMVSFTKIPPGDYRLKVKYYNRALDRESEEFMLRIHIAYPWYQSFFSYFVYLLLFAAAVFLLVHYLTLKNRQKKQEMLNHLEKEHQKDVFESKLRFFTNIAHEFCTPITLISGPCERIMANTEVGDFVKNYVQIIQANANRLNSLIRELIEFRRIETGNRELQIRELNITELSDRVVHLFDDLVDKQNIRFEINRDESMTWNSDEGFLESIMTNLLSNAFKYTPVGKGIKFDIRIEDKKLTLRVANEGGAINDQDMLRIFDRYRVLDNFEKQLNDSTLSRNGLGLAISYNMVQLLNGDIKVENLSESWVLFSVSLPYAEITELEKMTSNYNRSGYFPAIDSASLPKIPESEFDGTKHTILVIDDELEILWLMNDLFSPEFNVITLQDPSQIDKVLSEVYPHVIICDLMMPQMSGFDIVKQIKTTTETMHIPIVLISGKYDMEQQIEALEFGAEMYITKPFNTEYLTITIRQIIERKEKLREYFNSPMSSFEKEEGKLQHKEHKKFLQKVLKIINDNITNPELSTQFVADEIGMGVRSLYRKMEEIGEESPSTLIRECRLLRAKHLLLKTKMTVDEIVYKSGFTNKVTFFKTFSKKFGCTPKEYRNKNMDSIVGPK